MSNEFEDFIAWQKARKLTSNIYKISDVGKFARDFGLKDQIRRAGVGEAIEVGQILGGLRASVERRRNSLRV